MRKLKTMLEERKKKDGVMNRDKEREIQRGWNKARNIKIIKIDSFLF
jgi:hypothetical protein